MMKISETTRDAVASIATDFVGLVPHLGSLLEAIGPFGLEPRVRELAALAVAHDAGSARTLALHRVIGKAAGLTEDERSGSRDELTAAEMSAVALALATVGRPLPEELAVDPSDLHYPPEQIRLLRAVALAVDLDCQLWGCRPAVPVEETSTS